MKKWTLLFIMLGGFALSGVAQDDMYFVPSKKNIAKEKEALSMPTDAYYSGSNRSVEEYNRRGSSYEVLPADTGDVITFSAVEGIYPDSTADFALTRKMARWDGYEPSDSYWQGYRNGRYDAYGYWGWHSPWYYSSFYPWYDPWYYDPWYGWYDGWYGGWYDPWYYGYGWGYAGWYRPWHYGWYDPWYYGYGWGGYGWGGSYAARYSPGTQNHGRISGSGPSGFANGRTHSYSSGTFGGHNVGSFGGSRSSASRSSATRNSTVRQTSTYSNSSGNFGGSSSGSSYTPSRSSGSSGGGYSGGGGGSFGGSRSSGGGGGGSRSGGGFGSGRR